MVSHGSGWPPHISCEATFNGGLNKRSVRSTIGKMNCRLDRLMQQRLEPHTSRIDFIVALWNPERPPASSSYPEAIDRIVSLEAEHGHQCCFVCVLSGHIAPGNIIFCEAWYSSMACFRSMANFSPNGKCFILWSSPFDASRNPCIVDSLKHLVSASCKMDVAVDDELTTVSTSRFLVCGLCELIDGQVASRQSVSRTCCTLLLAFEINAGVSLM
jgi:hypothetical protein